MVKVVGGGRGRVAGGAKGGVKKDSSSISKKVGWLNKNAALAQPITFTEVIGPLSALNEAAAVELLDELGVKAPGAIKDPTGWLLSACANAGAGRGRKAAKGSSKGGLKVKGGGKGKGGAVAKGGGGPSVSQIIGRMNRHGDLQQPIIYNDVAGPLMTLGDAVAGQLLAELQGKGHDVRDPTAWLKKAAMRQGASDGEWVLLPSGGGKNSPAGTAGGKNQISKKIGQINKSLGKEQSISFQEVVGALNAMGEKAAVKLLEEFEQKSDEVKDPTRWIAAAAARRGKGRH